MNCEKYKDYIMKHMDKTITETEQIELDEHLKRCSECRLEYDELKNIVSVLEERSCVEPPADFENMVMKKINVLDIYHKKQRKKRILIYGFAFIFAFMTVLLMFAALCRESILGLLLAAGVSESLSYAVYGFLTRMDLFLAYMAYVSGSGKMAFSDFYYLLIGLVVIVLMSKTHEIKSVRVHQKSELPPQTEKYKKRKLIN